MLRKNVLIGAAACAALAFAGFTRAGTGDLSGSTPNVVMLDDATTMPASAPAATAPATPITPLMGALDRTPVGDALTNLGINVTGFVEGSWTYSAHPPAGNILTDRSFDTKTESLQFDAVDLAVVRTNDYTKPFDIGFTLEQLYGWDGAYIHSNGLTIYSPGRTDAAGTAAIHPKAQYDLNQANFTLSFKVGNGIGVEGGKFDTLVGYEVIDGPSNPFFSHSFIFAEEPFTQTGLLGILNLNDPASPAPATLIGGISRGWDQATRDNNGNIDATGQFKIAMPNKYNFSIEGITGNESPSGPFDGWRSLVDIVGGYQLSDQLSLGVNGMYAWQAQAGNGGAGGGTGMWYGAAAYLKYVQSDYLTFNVRGEWFDDQDGAAPTQLASGVTNIPNQFYEVTVGLTFKPLPDNPVFSGLAIRPEGRWDYGDHAAFNGGSQHDQWTGGVDAYYAF